MIGAIIGGVASLARTAAVTAVAMKVGERVVAHARTQAELYAMKKAARKAHERWQASPLGMFVNTCKAAFSGEDEPEVIEMQPKTEGEGAMFAEDTKEKLREAAGATVVAAGAVYREARDKAGELKKQAAPVAAAIKNKIAERLRGRH